MKRRLFLKGLALLAPITAIAAPLAQETKSKKISQIVEWEFISDPDMSDSWADRARVKWLESMGIPPALMLEENYTPDSVASVMKLHRELMS